MHRGGVLDHLKTVGRESCKRDSSIIGISALLDQSTLVHPGEVVVRPALGPPQAVTKFSDAKLGVLRLRQVREHVVVDVL